jgi:hypothetical protein
MSTNFTLVKHMSHPNGRTSYTIPGVSGNLVIFNKLFASGIAPDSLTLDVAVAEPVEKVDKALEIANKAAAKAEAAAKRLAEQTAKAAAKAEKVEAALHAAREKAEKLAAAASA